jgi:O-antigen/teichoic acid export membrane protein
MSRVRLLARGVFANWTAYAVAIITAFFLSPFIVHNLGNIAYGVWVIANSSIAYMALLDLGMRGAVTHFVAKHHARAEHVDSSRAVSAALGFRILIALAIVLASFVLALEASHIFRIPLDMSRAARWAIILTGLNLAFSLVVGVFGGVVAALNRFDLTSGVSITQTVFSALGIVWVLEKGHGIVALALVQLVVSLILNAVTVLLCFRVYPDLRISFRFLDLGILKPFWKYSFYLFIIGVTGRIIYYTDNLVVGAFLSAQAVTFYAIGGRFIEYLGELGASLSQTVMPMASELAARNQEDQLRRLLIQGTRACLLVSLPVGLVLCFRGPTFIGLWMGTQYAQPSGEVLRILLLSIIALAGNRVAANIVFGLGKHRPFALWQSGEAVANLALSIYLVRKIGIVGVAWGTVFPSLFTQLVIWPRYISNLLGLKVWTYFWQAWFRPSMAIVPFGLACLWTERSWTASNMPHFFLQIAAILPAVPLGICALFWTEVKWQVCTEDSMLRRMFSETFGKTAA